LFSVIIELKKTISIGYIIGSAVWSVIATWTEMDENEKFLERKRNKLSSSLLDQEIEQVAPQNEFGVIIIN
jgi:hypothetical protein